jgi:hypothetical protein
VTAAELAALHAAVFDDPMPPAPTDKVVQLRPPGIFTKLADAGFGDHILPALSKEKRPGRLTDDGKMIGLRNWPTLKMQPETLARYNAAFDAGRCRLCIRTGVVIAIDIDVLEEALADAIGAAALRLLGWAPTRTGQAPKRLLVYRSSALYRKVTIKLSRGETKYLVEMLAKGQHFVGYGEHKLGRPYTWDRELFDVGFNGLTLVTREQIVDFLAEAERIAAAAGFASSASVSSANVSAASDERSTAPKPTVTPDCVRAVGRKWLALEAPIAVKGNGGDATALGVAMMLHDYGYAEEDTYTDMLEIWNPRCPPGFREERLRQKVRNAFRYAHNEPGCKAPTYRFEMVETPAGDATGSESARADPTAGDTSADDAAATRTTDPAWLAELNAKYFVVQEAGKTVIYQPARDPVMSRHVLYTLQFEDFKKAYMNRFYTTKDSEGKETRKNIGNAWLQHSRRRQCLDGVVFAPGKDLGPSYFNLWRGFGTPPKQGSWARIHDHLLNVICSGDEAHFAYLIGWFARCFQLPGEQGEVAVALRGKKGIGKGMVGRLAARIFGQHYLHVSNPEHLVGRFNAHLRDAVFVFGDEAFYAGNKVHEATLKALVTEPWSLSEGKFKTAVMTKNVVHLLLSTNADWVAPMSSDERRYFMLSVSDDRRGDRAYFSALQAEIDGDGPGAMLHDLLRHDLSGFDVRDIPHTDESDRQKSLSFEGVDRVLHEWLQQGKIGGQAWTSEGLEIDKGAVHEAYTGHTRDYRPLGLQGFCQQVRVALGAAVCPDFRPYDEEGKRGKRLFGFAKLERCREAFAEHANAKITWETEPPEPSNTITSAPGVFDE